MWATAAPRPLVFGSEAARADRPVLLTPVRMGVTSTVEMYSREPRVPLMKW